MKYQRKGRRPPGKKTSQGPRDYPIATIAYYGPDDRRASKVVVGILAGKDDITDMQKWYSDKGDVRIDVKINQEIAEFIDKSQVKNVALMEGIIGCPHEEGKDYPKGESCPQCPFWEGRDRWTGELIN
ncbi:MAG TPA: hypothetical protein VF177_01815 [Anaerolineae bacterium]